MSASESRLTRSEFVITGLVQGVGMRPFLARLAAELGLAGSCSNTATSVLVDVEGDPHALAAFAHRLRADAPPLAAIDTVEHRPTEPTGKAGFVIAESAPTHGRRTLVAPDTATCADCLRELFDPADRRYRHPFITCTNCGPRFTITLDLPYDRPNTTMAGFPMCQGCAREYADPTDRRYHAQPIACHACGPRLALRQADGTAVAEGPDIFAEISRALADGRIVAIKGLGGYHLACDAADTHAVQRLRARKHRPDQPFAVMAADPEVAARVAQLSPRSLDVLTSPARPIGLVPRRPGSLDLVCPQIAPRVGDVGLMLPYTPVHHLLLADAGCPQLLVMTSGNRSGEPLCVADDEALARLAGIADFWLTHDRPIAAPCEDSVVMIDAEDRPVPVRRSRGYAPIPVRLPDPGGTDPDATDSGVTDAEAIDAKAPHLVVLAAGAELKNTFTVVRDGQAFVSAHVGDLGSLESLRAYEVAVDQAQRFHQATADLLVADAHPQYVSRRWATARSDASGAPLLEVYHHHAHLASLAAEHQRLDRPLLGLVFDGTGYGCDATVWGGELLRIDSGGVHCDRLGHLATMPLPGGDAGVRNPVRMAAAALAAAGIDIGGTPAAKALTDPERQLIMALPGLGTAGGGAAGTGDLRSGVGWVATSSIGRLFDAVSSLLGVCHRVTYEAQAAIELEARAVAWAASHPAGPRQLASAILSAPPGADGGSGDSGPDDARRDAGAPLVHAPLVLDPQPMLAELADAVRAGADPGELAYAFHTALGAAAARLAAAAAGRTGDECVGLTGGVFQNRLLTASTRAALTRLGLEPVTHRLVPPNDGGLSLGQAAIGLAWLTQETDRPSR